VIGVMILEVSEATATLEDYDTISALLAGSNTESAATNYARLINDDTDLAGSAVDDTNNRHESDMPDQVWSSLGPGNATVRIVTFYDDDSTGGTDANLIPATWHDFVVTPNGGDVTATINASGYFRAA